MRRYSVLLFCLLSVSVARADVPAAVSSPDGTLTFEVSTPETGPVFQVAVDGQVLFRNSSLGVIPVEGEPWGPGMTVVDVRTSAHDETWKPVWGTASVIRDHYNAARLLLRDGGGREMTVIVRAFDDAVAFRYRIPEGAGEVRLENERTAFHAAEDAKAWALPLGGFGSSYEEKYTVGPLSSMPRQLIGLPLTLEFSHNKWAAITEAHLEDYPGLYVEPHDEEPLTLRTRLARSRRGEAPVVRTAPFETPWRVLLLGRNAGDLIESQTILNLNPPNAIADTSWIKPGKTMWHWWSKDMASGVDFEGGVNTETMLHYAEFAAEAGFDYILIDEGWSWWENIEDENGNMRRVTDITRTVPEIDLPRILDYCHERGIGVWLWLTWGHCWKQMDEAFPLYEKWGIAGIKNDFMNSDDQWMVNWYHEVAEQAAEHKLMVNMHGAYKNTGIRRTWPNMMTREGVMGLEHSKWSDNVTPTHNTILPFTRMLAGPMDYTPGCFNVTTPERFRHRDSAGFAMGTLCHQLAQYVIYESPIQMCVDYPEGYRGRVGFEFLQWVPLTWDESLVLDGYPGEFIVMARRSGDALFIGALSNEAGRELSVPLDFLGEGRYRVEVFADGRRAAEVPEQVRYFEQDVEAGDVLEIIMAPSGGYAALLTPVDGEE